MDPTSDAFTMAKLPALISRMATISSVMLPSVALRRPPIRGPSLIAICSVERPMRSASGTMARAEVRKTSTGWPRKSATIEIGMKRSSQSVESRGRRLMRLASLRPQARITVAARLVQSMHCQRFDSARLAPKARYEA